MLSFNGELKRNLRKNLLSRRIALQKEVVKFCSVSVFNVLVQSSYFKEAESILFYYPHKNEIDLIDVIKYALLQNKKVLLPQVGQVDNVLNLHEIKNMDEDVEEGPYGIVQPKEKGLVFSPQDVDVFLIPGIAFDVFGVRLGYGYGYYDRLLQKVTKKICKIGVAYQWQIIGGVPREKYDVVMDFILTEEGIMRCKT